MPEINIIPLEELKDTFETISYKSHISPSIIEKDYWVTLLLYYLFNVSQYRDLFLLKGGTSLSKGHHYINRFSEDIDLVIKYSNFDVDLNEILYSSSSVSHRSVLCEKLNREVSDFIKNVLLNDIKIHFGELVGFNIDIKIDNNDPLSLKFYYPSSFHANYLLDYIKIETGSLSNIYPAEEVNISSLVEEIEHSDNPVSFKIVTLAPKRTFWEKVNILHINAVKDDSKKTSERTSRHYYDLYELAHTIVKEGAFSDLALQQETVYESDAFFHYGWLDITPMLSHQYTLIPSFTRLDILKKDYENMKAMIFGDVPSYDEIINLLTKLEEEIKNL
ncbi:MAG: nucleotidyl transferase AbiEii/AbiGii toxin family protein [Coprobacillus sp.]|nr:nucleotidyl transferase AbiEii/AbiGii toxin family protein [Coprobacillus sp.]